MSGGSWDYFFSRVHDVADALQRRRTADDGISRPLTRLTPEQHEARKRLGRHLVLVANALRAIEWVDSDDCSPGDEIEEIEKVFASARGGA